jgi:hypothetical protein
LMEIFMERRRAARLLLAVLCFKPHLQAAWR